MVCETNSERETMDLAAKLAAEARPGAVFTLSGELGAGKTVFARGFARGLGIEAHITSPTFTILQVYEEGRLTLYHFDAYRISDVMEAYDIGFDECLSGDGVCLVEWPEMVKPLLPEQATRVLIERVSPLEENKRLIRIVPAGC